MTAANKETTIEAITTIDIILTAGLGYSRAAALRNANASWAVETEEILPINDDAPALSVDSKAVHVAILKKFLKSR